MQRETRERLKRRIEELKMDARYIAEKPVARAAEIPNFTAGVLEVLSEVVNELPADRPAEPVGDIEL